ncbi:hypothetical protein Tsubulata_024556 [Turnera subulata]|uniref:Uncharacterized protein n=1 Tax=Turnera subulata TaxID=218843 RepID=A0A9Q0G790_9ROSI|nr:hypothetical protein Tsubulata_024556 [Turnera subulata]
MAFMISKTHHQSFSSEAEKLRLNHPEEEADTQPVSTPISRELHLLKSSSNSKALDKQVILRRIRHRKSLNKVRNAFQELVMKGSAPNQQNWMDPDDSFSSP